MTLGNLGVVEEARGNLRQVHEDDGANGEVRRDHGADALRLAFSSQLIEKRRRVAVVPMTRRAPLASAAFATSGVQAAC